MISEGILSFVIAYISILFGILVYTKQVWKDMQNKKTSLYDEEMISLTEDWEN